MNQAYSDTVVALLTKNPFYYNWVQQMQYKPSADVKHFGITFHSIGESSILLVNEEALEALTLKQRVYLLEHEILHWVYQHPLQPESRDKLYDLACDMAVNSLLEYQGAELLETSVTPTRFRTAMEARLPSTIDITAGMPDHLSTALSYYDWVKWVVAQIPPMESEGSGEDDGEGMEREGMESSGAGAASTGGQSSGGQRSSQGSSSEDQSSQGDTEEAESGDTEGDGNQGDSQEGSSGGSPSELQQQSGSPSQDPGEPSEGQGEGLETELEGLKKEADHSHWESVQDNPALQESTIETLAKEMSEAKSRVDPALFEKYCGDIAGDIENIFNAAKKHEVPWNRIVRQFVGYCGAVELRSTMGQLNKYGSPPKIKLLPGTNIAFLLDTSGSMSPKELSAALAELEAAHRAGIGIDVIEFDHEVQRVAPFRRRQEYNVKGRGGTSFINVLSWVKDNYRVKRYTGVIIFTDGVAAMPNPDLIPPKILWLVTGMAKIPERCGPVVRMKLDGK